MTLEMPRTPEAPPISAPIKDSEAILAGYQLAVDAKYTHAEDSPQWVVWDQICDRLCWLYVSASHAEKGESAPYPLGSPVESEGR